MKIAQVAPLYESVPPKHYGGTERIVSYLTEELVAQGHDVTLFASGDSVTRAQLHPGADRALRLDRTCTDPLAHHMVLLDRVMRDAHNFDIVHFHTDYLHFALSRHLAAPHVTTLHGRLDLPDLQPLYRQFNDVPVISISDEQRKPLGHAKWVATVHHGLPPDLHPFQPNPGKYLAFLGRISPEKRVDRAIEIARRAGMEIKIAAKIDRVDREYFEQHIEALLHGPGVEYIGEIGEREKMDFLGNALAVLFPIDWPEPFGLVTIEAMACGTPVIAWRHGAIPEIVRDGETGFIVDGIDAAVAAVQRIPTISRVRCRRIFEQHFSVQRMVRDYLAAYEAACSTSPMRRSVA